MKSILQTQLKGAPTPSFTPVHTGALQRKCACSNNTVAGGEYAECSKKRLQRKTRNSELGTRNDSSVPPIVHEVLRSPGNPLDPETRAFMEPRFRHDFNKVHTDATAGAGSE